VSRAARPVADLVLETADGPRLRGWLVGALAGRAPLVVYYGGNAEEVSWQAREAGWPADWSLALVNYRGYGASEGKPSERHLFADALVAFDALAGRPDVDSSRIVLFGRSLGSAVAVHVAAERPVAGVILVSPFESMIAVGRRHYPWLPVGLLLRHPFDSGARAPAIRAPLLAIVAEQDTIIPPVHSRRLFEAWGGPKRWAAIPHTDHNDVAGAPEFWAAVASFLRETRDR
jgi:pimeloyl-ACP methyl ester carboxylesterase